MSDKLLQSIKFPQLPDKYHILPPIHEIRKYDPEYSYCPGEIVWYNGWVYYCLRPVNPAGDFDDQNWIQISTIEDLVWWMFGLFTGFIGNGYNPDSYYYRGQFVTYNGMVLQCTNQTPDPAGDFNPDYWTQHWGVEYDINEFQGQIDKLANYIQPNYDAIRTYNIQTFNREDIDYDSETNTCSSIELTIPMDDLHDYILENHYMNDYEMYIEGYALDDEHAIFSKEFDILRLSSRYSPNVFDWQSPFITNPYLPSNNPNNPYIPISYCKLIIQRYTMDKETQKPERINLEDLTDLSDVVACWQTDNISGINNSEVAKFLQQDYTEVYKSLRQKIINPFDDSLSHDSATSIPIPLNEGNIALQFVGMKEQWSNINIQVQVKNSQMPMINANKVLTDRDKDFFIIHNHSFTDNENIAWDFCIIEISLKDGSSVTDDVINFINSNLNILRKPKSQSSPNPVFKNDSKTVKEFLNVAYSYVKAQNIYEVNQPTFLQQCYTAEDLAE